jgi:hypothetical protein
MAKVVYQTLDEVVDRLVDRFADKQAHCHFLKLNYFAEIEEAPLPRQSASIAELAFELGTGCTIWLPSKRRLKLMQKLFLHSHWPAKGKDCDRTISCGSDQK